MLRALIFLIYTHVSQYYKTLFQWEYKGIRLFVYFILKWKIEIFYTFSKLRIFHTPHFALLVFHQTRLFLKCNRCQVKGLFRDTHLLMQSKSPHVR